ncbi:hypothetical protein [Autumnicola psychrophila]|uniref:PKD domain-containing protein n=1 Tax=Autumnicola psychrophila TaxID=3075592 RepID=A0ABU3DQN4_9FLAO|nr:hypothetical protein [Zunongwangia sp. F225]MDT0685407.1 hypothetical protein [Zunongwangia sp. F225]
MKNLKLWFGFFLVGLLLSSCQSEEYSMGDKLDPSEIDFEVIQDYDIDAGGNTVILKFNTPGATPVWNYGTGKSSRAVDTVRFAFQGDYEINLDVITAGGVVDVDPVTISVTEDNLSYVEDPLWTKLTGGNGQSKTWLLDLDEEGTSTYFGGPLYFYGTNNGWLEGGSEWDGGATGCYEEGGDCWNWSPEWAGNTWLMPAGDYGSMTFSLEGGPFVTVDHQMAANLGEQSGTFFLDKDNHTLTLTDAGILHNEGVDACAINWGNVHIFSLTDDTMQLGVLRPDGCNNEGPAMLVYNFITEEYKENYVPEVEEPTIDEGFDPEFESGELLQILTGGPSSGRYWQLDANGNPIDWIASGMGWTENADSSRDWGWNSNWDELAANSWIRFDQWGGMNYTRNQNGVQTSGTFSINEENNEIILEAGNTLLGVEGHGLSPSTSTLKVIKAYDDVSRGIWLGTLYDESKDEWLAFHYILGGNSGGDNGNGSTEPTVLNFDNSKLVIGDIEEKGNLRLELFNEYGATKSDPGLTRSDIAFNEKIEVTFTLDGITLNEDAAGTYDAKIYFADGDWAPQGDGTVVTVNGDGTYTVTYEAPSAAQGTFVFVIDVVGIGTDITDMNAVSATIDEIIMY